jgi:hypothetical protein
MNSKGYFVVKNCYQMLILKLSGIQQLFISFYIVVAAYDISSRLVPYNLHISHMINMYTMLSIF